MDITQGVLNLYKKRGETPLERLQRFRNKHPEFNIVKMTYAGRLDPLAEGVLLVVYGNEIKNKNDYLALDKKYVFEMVFGMETDTYDLLGKITNQPVKRASYKLKTHLSDGQVANIENEKIQKELKKLVGKHTQKYPAYSSKTVKGKALFYWAKEGKLDQIEMPKREIEIFDLKLLGERTVTRRQFEKLVFSSISRVKGDFRQEEIKERWINFFLNSKTKKFIVMKLAVSCGSGTYVRSIVHTLGKRLKIGATTLSIVRTNVGKFSIHSATR